MSHHNGEVPQRGTLSETDRELTAFEALVSCKEQRMDSLWLERPLEGTMSGLRMGNPCMDQKRLACRPLRPPRISLP